MSPVGQLSADVGVARSAKVPLARSELARFPVSRHFRGSRKPGIEPYEPACGRCFQSADPLMAHSTPNRLNRFGFTGGHGANGARPVRRLLAQIPFLPPALSCHSTRSAVDTCLARAWRGLGATLTRRWQAPRGSEGMKSGIVMRCVVARRCVAVWRAIDADLTCRWHGGAHAVGVGLLLPLARS